MGVGKIKEVAEELAAAFVKTYKCPHGEAIDFFYDKLSKNEEVCKIIAGAASDRQLSKNATFKEFVKKNKKELYYKLRRYKKSDLEMVGTKEELLGKLSQVHVSTQERFGQNDLFYAKLPLGDATVVVDVGCGVQPLYFPKEKFPSVTKYIALDKDKESIGILQMFKEMFSDEYSWLHPRVWNIGDGWDEKYDVALMLKVVPVVKRIDASLLDALARVPATTIIVSGVKESMVKKHDIEHKERRAITKFIETSGRSVTGEFELDNEFFLILS